MSNPRRRRTVVVATTAIFVLVAQLPNLLNFLSPWGIQQQVDRSKSLQDELAKLDRASRSREIDPTELERRKQELIHKHQLAVEQSAKNGEQTARLANMVLPVGWLPLGVMSAAEGNVLPSILGLLGMTLIGTFSLWRAYRTTIGLYQGQATGRKGRPAPAVAALTTARKRGALLLEARFPCLSEPVSAIALGTFRSLLRSPETKMMLLTPVIMVPIFGSMMLRGRQNMPELLRPLVAVGGILVVLFGLLQLMSNQFGFDRDGFRVFVLCAARRRDILLGKNLAFVPVALVMALILLIIVQIACPMRLDHFLATLPQSVSMFLLFCILVNFLSIYAPFYVAAGTLKPSNPKLSTVLLQMVMFLFLFPLTQAVTLLPLGIEFVLRFLGWPANAPICLVLSVVECAVIVILYHFSLALQGDLFQAREQRILETVTNRAP
jgi:ABC-2 type transport system permease protein